MKEENYVVSFLANSDDEQDGAQPPNGPSTMLDDCIEVVRGELEDYCICPSQQATSGLTH